MWTYEITTGRLFYPEGTIAGTGYAGGNLGKVPEAVNNPEYEGVRNTGPLPEGFYTFGDPVDHTHLGPAAIPLEPDPGNNMLGRSGFYCHGDTVPAGNASEGCIIQPRPTRDSIIASTDRRLQVVAFLQPTTQTDIVGV